VSKPVTVICVGGGGGGAVGLLGGGGGGGGGWSQSDIFVTEGQTIWWQVGGAGAGQTTQSGNGGNGGNSWVNKSTNAAPTNAVDGALANGGQGGQGTSAGLGGSTTGAIGQSTFAGGNGGGDATNNQSGGGGRGGNAAGTGGGGGGGSGGSGVIGAITAAGTGGRGGIGFDQTAGGAAGAATGGAGGNAPSTFPAGGAGGGGGGGRTNNGGIGGVGGNGIFSSAIPVDFENNVAALPGAVQGPGGGGGGGGGSSGTNSTGGAGGTGSSGGGGGGGGGAVTTFGVGATGGAGLVFVIYHIEDSVSITNLSLSNVSATWVHPTAPRFIGAGTTSTSTGTSVTVDVPAGAVSGDYVIVHLQGNATISHDLPVGWTRHDSGGGGGQQIISRTHDGSAQYTFTTASNVASGVTIMVYRNVTFGAVGVWQSTALNPIPSTITVPTNGSINITFVGTGTVGLEWSMPAGWTQRASLTANRSHAAFQRDALVDSGSLAGVQVTNTVGGTNSRAIQVSLSPV